MGEVGPRFEPGQKFWYSDAGSDTLGSIIELASGKNLEEFVRVRLLVPLGMTETFFHTRKDPKSSDRLASLYGGRPNAWTKFWRSTDEPFYPFPMGSQSLYSTPQDYARFLAMLMDRGASQSFRILSINGINRILTPVSFMKILGSDKEMPTGFPGLKVCYGQMSVLYVPETDSVQKKVIVFGHSGSDGTIAWAWPELDLMILYFTQSRGGSTMLQFESEIHKHLIEPDSRDAATTL